MKSSFSGFGNKATEQKEEKKIKTEEEPKSKYEHKQKEPEIKIEKPQEQQMTKQSDKFLWLKAIIGGFFILGSSASIYLLIRYKKKFMESK